MRKSLYIKDASLRDRLFKLSMLCDDTNIQDYLYRIEDLDQFLKKMSP